MHVSLWLNVTFCDPYTLATIYSHKLAFDKFSQVYPRSMISADDRYLQDERPEPYPNSTKVCFAATIQIIVQKALIRYTKKRLDSYSRFLRERIAIFNPTLRTLAAIRISSNFAANAGQR
ncbi:hypothetical protein CEXT_40701 [Caerostris extrusa]|uniref:Uncharacterized protein n=1 Tax=Caerostris extrusa TaxID=172846 RepID=A0AAV4VYT4_CAEEX|nr:hypothetical protein CEXT_40701 [Caerostris extrusa]